MTMQHTLLFSGSGGQGVMFAGQLLAYAGMAEGMHVTWIPSYGPEMRGGTAHCFVIISDKQIGSPIVRHPLVAVLFNEPAFQKYEPLIAEGGFLVTNSSLVMKRSKRTDITSLYIPASSIADELGEAKLANMVMVGAIVACYPAISLNTIHQVLGQHVPEHRHHLLALNDKALDMGDKLGRGALVPN
ncbi:MAG: 2-oxoacid:acceptor oxidoreductase family protein [Anaerolineae bacterium]